MVRPAPACLLTNNRRYSSTAVEFPNLTYLSNIYTMNYPESLRAPESAHACAHIRAHDVNVLIACEESQTECLAFRQLGFNAYSCDILPCRRGGNPYYHIQSDVTGLLSGDTAFVTQAGFLRTVSRWHLIIAHPPCTYLCRVGSVHMVRQGVLNEERYTQMLMARDFFFKCLDSQAPFVAVENPIPMARAGLPRPTTFVQPYEYGAPWSKKTYLWLRNLPPLMPTAIIPRYRQFVRAHRGKYRSRSFPGIAQAMAEQWGSYILNSLVNF